MGVTFSFVSRVNFALTLYGLSYIIPSRYLSFHLSRIFCHPLVRSSLLYLYVTHTIHSYYLGWHNRLAALPRSATDIHVLVRSIIDCS